MSDTTLTPQEARLAAAACMSQAELYEDSGDGMADCESLYEAADKLFLIAGDEVSAADARKRAHQFFTDRMNWENEQRREQRLADEED